MASYNININSFRSVLDTDDFIDHLIAEKIINKKDYDVIYSKQPEDRLNYIIDIVDNDRNYVVSNRVLDYLKDLYPNIEEIEREQHKYHEALVRGGFPKLPTNYVKRTSVAETLTNKLKNLNRGEKLVVHGMMGCGKSFLVNQVLTDKNMVKNFYDYKLFWVNLGEHHNLDNILVTMWRLYSVTITVIKGIPISHCPDRYEDLKQRLKEIFLHFEMRQALLILDDAGSEEVISAFDFGCKTIITTKNKKIVPEGHATFVEVNSAFTEDESLKMFSCLGNTEEIINNSLDICRLCKGYPLLITTISMFLKESKEDVDNPKIWEYIKSNLEGGKYEFSEENKTLDNAIKMCVDNLTDNLKSYFYDLSIFQQDVNIIPEVLEILWRKDLIQVRSIMKQLADRSLVVSFYHNDRKSYVYGVHDVFLNYLKRVTSGNRVELHRKLIRGYNRVTNGDYLKLPNDNYTLQYIGYHLKEADETDKFQIYLNLKFIEAKIRAAGHADVLRDMHTYGGYINKGEDFSKVNDYIQFINRFGKDIFYNDKIDIIQFALQEPEDSFVYKDAFEFAVCNPTIPYFKMKRRGVHTTTRLLRDKQDITSACYLNANEILIGTSSGNIELYDNERKMYSLNEHNKAVTSLKLNSTKCHLLSVSKDCSVRLWKLRPNTRRSWDLSAREQIADARDRQVDWKSIHFDEPSVNSKLFNLNSTEEYYITASFAPDFSTTKQIAIGTNKGVVTIWDTDTMLQITSTGGRRGMPVKNLMFVKVPNQSDLLIIFSLESTVYMWTFDRSNNKLIYLAQLFNYEVPNSVFLNVMKDSGPEIVCVNQKNIAVWQIENNRFPRENYELSKNTVCATMTNDSHYLVVSTSENSLYIWDNKQHKIIDVMYYWGLTKSLDTYYDEQNSVHMLLISSDKRSLLQCEITPDVQNRNNTDFPVFSSWWNKSIPLTAVRGKSRKLEIYHDYTLFAETEEIEDNITYIQFCDHNTVIYGLANGQVRLFEFKSRNDKLLTQIKGPVTHIGVFGKINKKIFVASKGDITVLYNNNNRREISREFSNPKLFFAHMDLLYVVEDNGNISSWDVCQDDVNVWFKNPRMVEIVTATLCSNKKQLALTGKIEEKYFVDILRISSDVIEFVESIELHNQPTFSRYSYDGNLLAIGMKSGDIQVRNTRGLTTILKFHETPVEYLLFSPGLEPILVSMGDQIAWWNLKKLQRNGKPSHNSIGDSQSIGTMNTVYWSSKRGFKDGHFLIACIKLHEQYAKLISASPDFTSFLTVDGTGRIYIMQVVLTTT